MFWRKTFHRHFLWDISLIKICSWWLLLLSLFPWKRKLLRCIYSLCNHTQCSLKLVKQHIYSTKLAWPYNSWISTGSTGGCKHLSSVRGDQKGVPSIAHALPFLDRKFTWTTGNLRYPIYLVVMISEAVSGTGLL